MMQYVPMAQQGAAKTAYYTAFRGVDMSSDPIKVDASRSPYAPNLVSDSGGFPEKRVGWRTLARLNAPINGIFSATLGGRKYLLVHAGDTLFDLTASHAPITLKTGVTNAHSVGFFASERFWILTGGEYLVFDGETVRDVAEIAYRPVTSIGRSPLSGGTAYEDVNLLTPKRENRFLADGSAKKYQLDTTELDSVAITAVVNGQTMQEGSGFTVSRTSGIVTFSTAPPAPSVSGVDNVSIFFEKTIPGAYEKIAQATIAVQYGGGGNGYVFVAGNPQTPATDYHSVLRNPAYFPDTGYSLIGSEDTAIMGYARLGSYLAIIKEEDEQNSTIFLREYKLDNVSGDRTQAVFALEAGISGTGAVAKHGVGQLADEPLFLSPSGVYAITSNAITAERSVENRSYFIDAKLCAERNLSQALCVEWNGRFLVAVNGTVYVLDGRQAAARPGDGKKVYECFHWDNIPAVCFFAEGSMLYFGTADGRVCCFNTDLDTLMRFSDDGKPIKASWSTKADDDGDFMRYKRFLRHGCGVLIKPYARSGCTIRVRTEEDYGKVIRIVQSDTFDFTSVDFTRFTFLLNDAPRTIPFYTGSRRYRTAQIIVENDAANEGFGVFGIMRRFRPIGFLKR